MFFDAWGLTLLKGLAFFLEYTFEADLSLDLYDPSQSPFILWEHSVASGTQMRYEIINNFYHYIFDIW